MGRSTFALVGFLAFFSVILFACITEARKNLEDFQPSPSTISTNHDEAKAKDEKQFMKDFDSRNAQFLWYHRNHDEAKAKNEKQFMHDFDSKNANLFPYQYHVDVATHKEEKPIKENFDATHAQLLLNHGDDARSKK